MSQVSKVDECLNFHNYAVAKDPASNTQANQTTKQALLSIILEARPADNNDGNGFQAGHWAALAEWEDNIKKVFGVEG